jgi:hypothetical protein
LSRPHEAFLYDSLDAERRVDIARSSGSGNDAHRSMMPRDIDYARMSDADILNM